MLRSLTCATCVGVGDVADIVDDVGVAVYVVSGVGVCNTFEFAKVRCCDCRGCGCHCGGCGSLLLVAWSVLLYVCVLGICWCVLLWLVVVCGRSRCARVLALSL